MSHHTHKHTHTHTYTHTHTHLDYQCGSPSNWSSILTLQNLGNETSSPTFAVYGDFGLENARSLPWLIDDATKGNIDVVLHAGDIAYNLFNVRQMPSVSVWVGM